MGGKYIITIFSVLQRPLDFCSRYISYAINSIWRHRIKAIAHKIYTDYWKYSKYIKYLHSNKRRLRQKYFGYILRINPFVIRQTIPESFHKQRLSRNSRSKVFQRYPSISIPIQVSGKLSSWRKTFYDFKRESVKQWRKSLSGLCSRYTWIWRKCP